MTMRKAEERWPSFEAIVVGLLGVKQAEKLELLELSQPLAATGVATT